MAEILSGAGFLYLGVVLFSIPGRGAGNIKKQWIAHRSLETVFQCFKSGNIEQSADTFETLKNNG